MRALPILLLGACSQTEVVIGHDLKGCEDYDPANPPVEQLAYEERLRAEK